MPAKSRNSRVAQESNSSPQTEEMRYEELYYSGRDGEKSDYTKQEAEGISRILRKFYEESERDYEAPRFSVPKGVMRNLVSYCRGDTAESRLEPYDTRKRNIESELSYGMKLDVYKKLRDYEKGLRIVMKSHWGPQLTNEDEYAYKKSATWLSVQSAAEELIHNTPTSLPSMSVFVQEDPKKSKKSKSKKVKQKNLPSEILQGMMNSDEPDDGSWMMESDDDGALHDLDSDSE